MYSPVEVMLNRRREQMLLFWGTWLLTLSLSAYGPCLKPSESQTLNPKP